MRCASCGLVRVELADVEDALGFARAVLDEMIRRDGSVSWARRASVAGASGAMAIDYEALLGDLYEAVWDAYLAWEPSRTASFRSHAAWKLRNRISEELRDEFGDTSGRTRTEVRSDGSVVERPNRRTSPKPLAVSVSLDAPRSRANEGGGATEADDGASGGLHDLEAGRLGGAPGAGAGDPADDRSPDLARVLGPPRRRPARRQPAGGQREDAGAAGGDREAVA